MVFESVVVSVLSQALGDYVCDLQTSQLSVSLFSGQVELNNLLLKTSALDKFNLPITVKEGYMGRLVMSIPWSDLKNKPILVTISDVYLLAVPKADRCFPLLILLFPSLQNLSAVFIIYALSCLVLHIHGYPNSIVFASIHGHPNSIASAHIHAILCIRVQVATMTTKRFCKPFLIHLHRSWTQS